MEILKLSALVLITVILVSGLPTFSREITVIITCACCIAILLYILNLIVPAVEYIKRIAESVAFDGTDVVLKAVGVGFITQFVSDIASDCGNKSLSNQMIFAGRICVLILAMPVFMQIFEIIERLIN